MNSKQKGAAFEREVCKKLSLWISNGKSKDCFWRSAMSGGRATVAKKKGDVLKQSAGDITAIAEGLPMRFTNTFYIECKFYKNLELDKLLYGRGKLHNILRKTKEEAAKYDKYPMVIFKENGRPAILCWGVSVFDIFSEPEDFSVGDFYFVNFEIFCKEFTICDWHLEE